MIPAVPVLILLFFPHQLTATFLRKQDLIRNHHMQELYDSYPACVIHIIDLIGHLDLTPPRLPVVVDKWPKELESAGNSSDYLNRMIDLAERRIKSRPRASKLHRSCLFSFVLAGKTSLLRVTPSRHAVNLSPEAHTLRILLRQDFTVALKMPWDESGAKVLSFPPIFFPESTIIFCEHLDVSIDTLDQQIIALDFALFYPGAAHLPTIILIISNPQHLNDAEAGKILDESCGSVALLFCLYCAESSKFLPLSCINPIRSAELTASDHAVRVPWLGIDQLHHWENEFLKPCPFTLDAKKAEFCAAEHVNIESIAFANLNSTFALKALPGDLHLIGLRFPAIIAGTELFLAEFIAPRKSLQFGLITADSVYLTDELTNAFPLLQPFNTYLWIGIAVASVALALSMAGLNSEDSLAPLNAFCDWMYRVLVVPLAQPRLPAVRKLERANAAADLQVDSKIRLLWAVWLISTVALSSSYNAVFKANYFN